MRSLITRRSFLGGCIGVSGALLAGASQASGKLDQLVVGCWGGSSGAAVKASVGDPFEKEFGVKVVYDYGGDTEHKAKVRAEKGHQRLDVLYNTPGTAYVLAKEANALVPIADMASLIPNLADLYKNLADPNIWTEWGVAPWTYAWTLIYRTDKISKEDAAKVDSWAVLLDPKYKGKVGYPNINWGNGYALLVLALIQGQGTVESGHPREVDKGWELVPKIKSQVSTFTKSDMEAQTLFKSGEIWIAMRSSREVPVYQKEGVPTGMFTNLKEGMVATNEIISVVRSGNALREEMAARFVNKALSAEAQTVLAKNFFTPSNKRAQIPADVKDYVLTVDQLEKLNHWDWIWDAQMLDQWTERWNRMISS
jgi:putative spermidine/putrescine transport system substrate-binding protein